MSINQKLTSYRNNKSAQTVECERTEESFGPRTTERHKTAGWEQKN